MVARTRLIVMSYAHYVFCYKLKTKYCPDASVDLGLMGVVASMAVSE